MKCYFYGFGTVISEPSWGLTYKLYWFNIEFSNPFAGVLDFKGNPISERNDLPKNWIAV